MAHLHKNYLRRIDVADGREARQYQNEVTNLFDVPLAKRMNETPHDRPR